MCVCRLKLQSLPHVIERKKTTPLYVNVSGSLIRGNFKDYLQCECNHPHIKDQKVAIITATRCCHSLAPLVFPLMHFSLSLPLNVSTEGPKQSSSPPDTRCSRPIEMHTHMKLCVRPVLF